MIFVRVLVNTVVVKPATLPLAQVFNVTVLLPPRKVVVYPGKVVVYPGMVVVCPGLCMVEVTAKNQRLWPTPLAHCLPVAAGIASVVVCTLPGRCSVEVVTTVT